MRPRSSNILLTAALLALAWLTAAPAEAQRRSSEFGGPPPARNVAGQFDYYALVLSWSPTHCAGVRPNESDPQCNRRDGRRYAFVLHGLWPQHEKGWPEYCPTARRPFVPQPVIDDMMDIMPSPKLIIHEYRKHGVCAAMEPKEYYALSRKLFERIKVPAAYVNPSDNKMVGPDDLMDEFIRANPGLKPDMLAVSCGGPGNRLREVRVCFNRNGEFRACGRNEEQRRLCNAQRMFVPPVRNASSQPDQPNTKGSPLPGPRMIPGVGR